MILIWAMLYFPYSDSAGVNYDDRIAAVEKKKDTAEEEAKALEAAGQEVPEEIQKSMTDAEDERNAINGEWKRNSYMGRVGRFLEPAFEPLGWDWRIGMAAIASFPAREVFVGMLGIVYDLGDEPSEGGSALPDALRKEWTADPVRGRYAVVVALSVMVFVALCLQCASTLAVIHRETKGWAWPAFTFAYMTTLAYAGAFVTFKVGRLIVNAVG